MKFAFRIGPATNHPLCAVAIFVVAVSCRPVQTYNARMVHNEGIALSDAIDPATHRYRLLPGLPRASNVKRLEIRVAVIDSGVLEAHPQIKGLIVAEKDFTGEGIGDRVGHGTVVTLGILGTDYIQSTAVPSLVIAKVASKNVPPTPQRVSKAIDWVADQNVQLVNLSLGFTGKPEDFADVKQAIQRHPAVLFLAAAGNSGPFVKVYPAAFAPEVKNVVSVASPEATSGLGQTTGQATPRLVPEAEYDFDAAISAARAGRFPDARQLFEAVLRLGSTGYEAEANVQLALLDIQGQQWDSALDHLNRALTLGARNPKILVQLGATYYYKRDFISAAKAYRESISLDPSNAQVHEDLGITLMNLGEISAGIAEFSEAVDLAPHNGEFQANLQQALAEQMPHRQP